MEQDTQSKTSGHWAKGLNPHKNDSSDFYTIERQIGKQVEMINFCLKTGIERAFALVGIDEVRFTPEMGIVLFGRAATIHISGQNLQALHRLLVARKVKEVREFAEGEISKEALKVSSIKIHSDYDGH